MRARSCNLYLPSQKRVCQRHGSRFVVRWDEKFPPFRTKREKGGAPAVKEKSLNSSASGILICNAKTQEA